MGWDFTSNNICYKKQEKPKHRPLSHRISLIQVTKRPRDWILQAGGKKSVGKSRTGKPSGKTPD